MAYGFNPFSEKTNFGGMLQDILAPIAQMLMMKKMYPGEQQGMKMPGAQAPTMPIQRTQTPLPPQPATMQSSPAGSRGGEFLSPMGGQARPQMGMQGQMPTGDVTGGNTISEIAAVLPPHLRAKYLEQVRLGKWAEPKMG